MHGSGLIQIYWLIDVHQRDVLFYLGLIEALRGNASYPVGVVFQVFFSNLRVGSEDPGGCSSFVLLLSSSLGHGPHRLKEASASWFVEA